jgi:hypothetical protein
VTFEFIAILLLFIVSYLDGSCEVRSFYSQVSPTRVLRRLNFEEHCLLLGRKARLAARLPAYDRQACMNNLGIHIIRITVRLASKVYVSSSYSCNMHIGNAIVHTILIEHSSKSGN